MTISLDNDSKRILRSLTKAIDRLAHSKWDESDGRTGVKRLVEPSLTEDLQGIGEAQLRESRDKLEGDEDAGEQ